MSHEGIHTHRLKQNPMEKAFAKAWKKHNKDGDTLEYLMSKNNRREGFTHEEEVTAATVIQWLGSPVGQNFLNEVGFFHVSQGFPEDR